MYLPKLEEQLDGSSTQGADCGIASVVMELDYASTGKVRPSTEEVRRRAKPLEMAPAVKLGEAERALESYGPEFEKKGLRPPEMIVRRMSPFETAVAEPLDKGQAVHLMLDYAWVNRRAPQYSSSPTFQGFHSAMALGRRSDPDGPGFQIRVFDPLADGRRSGIHQGPRWWPEWVVAGASESFVRRSLEKDSVPPVRAKALAEGNATAGAVKVARTLPDPTPPPDPTPAETPAETIARLRREVDSAVTARQEALDQLAVALADDAADLEALYEAQHALLDAKAAIDLGLEAVRDRLPGNTAQAEATVEDGTAPEPAITEEP